MANSFANAAKHTVHSTATENGHYAVDTTDSALLDLYGTVGALRNADETHIRIMLDKAVGEDKLLAAKTMFYARDVRCGTGERKLFRTMLERAANKHPEIIKNNIALIGEYGRYDDMYALVGTKLEDEMWSVMKEIFESDRKALAENKPVTLLAKWIKSPNSKQKETRRLGRLTCEKLGYKEPEFRKILSALRACENIVERPMSARNWSAVDYQTVPSKASLLYRNAFKTHDEKRYNEFLQKVQENKAEIKTGAVTPYDLVHRITISQGRKYQEDETVEAMWKNLPDYVNADTNVLCMVDTSGSMYGRPLEVALALGLYFAEKNTGDFHNLFMTFSESPEFQHIPENVSLADKLHTMCRAKWSMNTDLKKAFLSVLDLARKNRIPQKDMPKSILVISDMEIDAADYSNNKLFYDEVAELYSYAGYEMPNLIFWNVESRANRFQTAKDRKCCQLASGESIAVFKQVIDCIGLTPYEAMLKTLNSSRYDAITIA